MLKKTYYERSSNRSSTPQVVMIGQMYVQFQIPMKYNDWPLIFVSGGAHTGASLESTPDGREGWAHYALRKDIPTFNVDQSGRGRSGFDASAIHEGVAKLTDNDPANDQEGRDLIPNFLVLGTADWWNGTFGHLLNPATGEPTVPGPAQRIGRSTGASRLEPVGHRLHHDAEGVMTQFPIHATSPEIIPDNLLPKGEQVCRHHRRPDGILSAQLLAAARSELGADAALWPMPHLHSPGDRWRWRFRLRTHVDVHEHRGAG